LELQAKLAKTKIGRQILSDYPEQFYVSASLSVSLNTLLLTSLPQAAVYPEKMLSVKTLAYQQRQHHARAVFGNI